MKLRKRIAAFGAAMVMAVSMMSIGASATDTISKNWLVRRVIGTGVPGSLTITECKNLYQSPYTGSSLYLLSDTCLSFSSGYTSSGQRDKVTYVGYYGDTTGNYNYGYIFQGYEHNTDVPPYNHNDTNIGSIGYGSCFWVKYYLSGPTSVSANISGTGTVYRT